MSLHDSAGTFFVWVGRFTLLQDYLIYYYTGHTMINRVRRNFGSYSRIISEIYRDQKIKSRAETEKDRIEIDLSRLDAIRSDAALTRDRLMTDEERYAASSVEQRADMAEGAGRSAETAADPAGRKEDKPAGGYGFEDELWRMFDEYSEEDSTDPDQLS